VVFSVVFRPRNGFYAFLDQLNKNDDHVMVTRAIMVRHKEIFIIIFQFVVIVIRQCLPSAPLDILRGECCVERR